MDILVALKKPLMWPWGACQGQINGFLWALKPVVCQPFNA
jgi:hypothetical protein